MEAFLFPHWDVAERWLRHKNIFLFLDYDGTLTPIVSRPQEAVLSREVESVLIRLAGLSNCKVAIVSGRSLSDIKSMVGIDNIYYAGNHGLEIEGPDIDFNGAHFSKSQKIIDRIREKLERKCAEVNGVYLEDKGISLSYHYRMVTPNDLDSALKIFEDVIRIPRARGQIKILSGKKVFEVRPAINWDKGNVLAWFLDHVEFGNREFPVGPVYIGDDITDEDAFRYLKGNGLTVWVGEGRKTIAQYLLRDTADVLEFLKRLFLLLSEG